MPGPQPAGGRIPAPGAAPAAGEAADGDAPAPAPGERRRVATKRQQAQLAGLADRLEAVDGRGHVAAAAMREAAELIGADTTALVVRSIHGPRILWQHPGSEDPELWGARTLAALLARPEPVRVAVKGDPLTDGGRTALVTAPVPAAGGSVGVIVARRLGGRAFTAADEDALSRLGRIAGARLHRTAERTAVAASSVDPATRLGAHELLMADLAQTLADLPVHGMPSTLVVAEVVDLPQLRAERGMAAADAVISAAAVRVGGCLRVGDLLYRQSADELAVLLPATDADNGEAVARRLAALQELPHGVSLRAVAVPVEQSPEAVMLAVLRALEAARSSAPAIV